MADYALKFTGSEYAMLAIQPASTSNEKWELETKVRIDDVSVDATVVGNFSGTELRWMLYYDAPDGSTPDGWTFLIYDGVSALRVGGYVPTAGETNKILIAYDRDIATAAIYVDDVLIDFTGGTSTGTFLNVAYVGQDGTGARFFKGLIEYVHHTQTITTSRNRQYDFNEGSGISLSDTLMLGADGDYFNAPALDAQWELLGAGGPTTHEVAISLLTNVSNTAAKQAIFGVESGFTVDGGISQGSQAQFETAALIAQQLGLQSSLGAFIDASATFNSDMNQLSIAVGNLIAQSAISFNSTIQVSNSKVLDAGATLVTSQDLASTSTVSTEVVSGFALNSNQVSVSQQDFLANSVMSTSQGFDGTAESNLLASMSMGSIINLQSVSGSDINASASLLVSSLLSTSFSTAIEGTGSYGVSCAIASQVIAELTSEASFDVVSGMISQANAILLAQAQLNTGNTFSVKSGQVIEAYGELTVTSSIGVDGVIVLAIEFKPLKDGHNVLVLAQNKTVTVTKQDRNIIVLN